MQTDATQNNEETPAILTEVAPRNNVSLIESERSLIVRPKSLLPVDPEIVRFQYYNSFNYSILAQPKDNVKLILGITSPNEGEGKTTTASNLAVSLTLGSRKRTLIIDMNLRSPRLHEIFGAGNGPGLIEALNGAPINIVPTALDNLYVLCAGRNPSKYNSQAAIGIEFTSAFGEVLHRVETEFDFVIVDMPALSRREFPILFINHLHGLLVVVELGKTKRRDVDKIFRQLNENQVLGFVFNRVLEDD